MDIKELLASKEIKPKEKVETLSKALLDKALSINELIDFARASKEAAKATCIEALEYATKQKPETANADVLAFVTGSLTDKAPRVKWESAKVIGNIAHLFPKQLYDPVKNLLDNTRHTGTVVRWSAAFALGEIIKLKTSLNTDLVPAAENIMEQEEKNSIKKIYQAALKKAK